MRRGKKMIREERREGNYRKWNATPRELWGHAHLLTRKALNSALRAPSFDKPIGV
jgi:hypothetical protein